MAEIYRKFILMIFVDLVTGVSIDCPKMVTFAYYLGMYEAQYAIYGQVMSDCCTAAGVTCASQRVTQIDWNSRGLNGTIYGNLPSTLTSLILNNNQLNGGIPSNFPNGLINLNLQFNQLTGPIPSVLPSGLHTVTLEGNRMNGSIPSPLPTGLNTIYLYGNQMSGDLPALPITIKSVWLGYPGYSGNHFTGRLILNQPQNFFINDNWITDVIVQDTSSLTSCDLSNNPLLGNSRLSSLTMCTKNNLYSASLSPYTGTTSMVTRLGSSSGPNNLYSASSMSPSMTSMVTMFGTSSGPNNLYSAGSMPPPTIASAAPTVYNDWSNFIEFAIGLGMQVSQPLFLVDLKSQSCNGHTASIQCVDNRVTGIYWPNMGLKGLINGSAIPLSLIELNLDNNQLSGPIPSVLPGTLTTLTLQSNSLNGSLPQVLPSGLTTLSLRFNKLTGILPLFPTTLQYLELNGNQFTGVIRLKQPVKLTIPNNLITDVIIQDTTALTNCDISYNPLLGSPGIGNLTMCAIDGIYSSTMLSGSIGGQTLLATTTTVDASNQNTIATILPSTAPKVSGNGIIFTLQSLATSTTVDALNQNTIAAANNGLTIVPVVIGVVIVFLLLSIFAVKRVRKYLERQKDLENLKNAFKS